MSRSRAAATENPFIRVVKEQRGIYRVPEPKILAGSNYADLGFDLVATAGTAAVLDANGVAVERVAKGDPVVDLIRSRGVDLVVNTPQGRNARRDGYAIREAAVIARVPCITTLAVARAAVEAIAKARDESAVSLQERHEARAS